MNPEPTTTEITADVIAPIVRRWFTHAGAHPSCKIWLYSHSGSAEGYTVTGTSTLEAQQKVERSKHYRLPEVPADVTHLCYTDGERAMDFAACEIHQSLSESTPNQTK